MRFLRILLVAATLFGRLYSCSQSEVLCKTTQVQEEQAQRELRNKMFPEDKFTEEDKELLQTLPHEVISIIAAYAVESWEDYSGIKVGTIETPALLWGTCEKVLPLALRKTGAMFTWIPKNERGKSVFVAYNGLNAPITFPYKQSAFVVLAATIDGTGRSLITADDHGIIWFWDAEVGIVLGKEQTSNERVITGLAVSSNNNFLMVSNNQQGISLFAIKKEKTSGLCCGIRGQILSRIFDATICQGTGIACDACNRLVFVEDYQKTAGKGVILVHQYTYNQSTKELDYVCGDCLAHEGTVRSVVLNREATRLAVVSDDQDEEREWGSSFYYSCVTLWDLVQKKHLIHKMCKKSPKEEPVHQVALMGHNALVIQESPKGIMVVHAPEEDSYKKRTKQFKQGYALSIQIPEKRIEYFW